MKEYTLLRAIGEIGEDLIAEGSDDAAFFAACRARRLSHPVRGLLAACVALVMLVLPLFSLLPAMLPAAGGNAMPPEYAGDISDGLLDDVGNGDLSFSVEGEQILVSPLPQQGSAADGVTLQISLPAWKGYTLLLCTESEGVISSQTQIDLSTVPLDPNGRHAVSITLWPKAEASEGSVTFSVVWLEKTLWQKTCSYRVTDDMLTIDQ